MPRQKLTERTDGRYNCKYQGKSFYGRTQTEAQAKRDKYIRDCTLGYDPDLSETRFLEYALEWLEVYRDECNPKQRRQYEGIIETAAGLLNKQFMPIQGRCCFRPATERLGKHRRAKATRTGQTGGKTLHPEPGRENEHCCIGSSRSEAQPSGASEHHLLSIFHLLF